MASSTRVGLGPRPLRRPECRGGRVAGTHPAFLIASAQPNTSASESLPSRSSYGGARGAFAQQPDRQLRHTGEPGRRAVCRHQAKGLSLVDKRNVIDFGAVAAAKRIAGDIPSYNEDVIPFMFHGAPIVICSLVEECSGELRGGGRCESQFLSQSPERCAKRRLPGPRMSADGVAPESAERLCESTPLQKPAPAVVNELKRHSEMTPTGGGMCVIKRQRANQPKFYGVDLDDQGRTAGGFVNHSLQRSPEDASSPHRRLRQE